ncbi:MAG: hypothetical protein F6K39_46345 [Okeania sp. SIO3B3]|nr:hypothetical protein [Okeania sp. SIO3B3]
MMDVSEYEVKILGAPELFKDGRHISLSRQKSIGLIVYLAATERRAAREELVELFWPDASPGRGLASLRTSLNTIRSALGDDILIFENGGVSLNFRLIWTDLKSFREAIQKTITFEVMASAAGLWRGDSLKGFT